MRGEFTVEYVVLPKGRMPARDFIDSLDDEAAARVDAFVERLRAYGTKMHGKFVRKLTEEIMELRVKHFDRIFRVLYFYQPGMLIVITSGFQKKTDRTLPSEIARAGSRRQLWLKYHNSYPESPADREKLLREEKL